MKLFLARWPDHKVSLLGAQQAGDVFDHLHDEGDPSQCTIETYNKPFCLTFAPKVSPEVARQVYHDPFPPTPNNAQILAEDLSSLFKDETLADITFLVEDKSIQCHKAILAARCSYFKAMFTSGMQEAAKNEVEIKECNYHLFLRFIDFLYTGAMSSPSMDTLRMTQNRQSDMDGPREPDSCEDSTEEKKSPRTQESESSKSDDQLVFKYLLDMMRLADFYGCQSLFDTCQVELASHCSQYLGEKYLVSAYQAACSVHNPSILMDYLPYLVEKAMFRDQISENAFLHEFPQEFQDAVHNIHENIRGAAPFVFGKDRELRIILNALQFNVESIQNLLEKERLDLDRVRALHMALEFWDTDVANSCDEDVVKACELCLEKGADSNLTDKCGNTPLHLAAKYLAEPLIYRFLNAGARPDCRNDVGKTYWDLLLDAEKMKSAEEAACLFDSQTFLYEQRISYSLDVVREIKDRVQRDAMDRGIWEILEDPMLEEHPPDYSNMGIKINDEFYKQFVDGDMICTVKKVHFDLYFLCPGLSFGQLFDDIFQCAFPNTHDEFHDLVTESEDNPGFKYDAAQMKEFLEGHLEKDTFECRRGISTTGGQSLFRACLWGFD